MLPHNESPPWNQLIKRRSDHLCHPQVVTDAESLDPIAADLLYPREAAVYAASRKGRLVGNPIGQIQA